MIRALVFDYNQVIVNDLEAHVLAYERALKKFGVKMPKEELREIMYWSHGKKTKYLEEKFGLQKSEKEIFLEKQSELLKIAKEKNLMFPGAQESIERLAKKYLLAIFTSTTKEQVILPEKTKKLFIATISYEDITKQKPDPDGLLKCMEKIKSKPEESAYIGDATNDMQAAKNANCMAIGITTGRFNAEELRKAGADIVIGNLKELVEMEL